MLCASGKEEDEAMGTNAELYDQDFYAWTQEQTALLREGKWHALDCKHLIEEIEDLGRSARKELRSYLEGLVLHLLKWRYQPDYRGHSWRDSIEENRARIPDCLAESQSLRPQLPKLLQECYPHARRKAVRQTRLPLATLPETCLWAVERILDDAFWPAEDVPQELR
jgi:hypothetical protein